MEIRFKGEFLYKGTPTEIPDCHVNNLGNPKKDRTRSERLAQLLMAELDQEGAGLCGKAEWRFPVQENIKAQLTTNGRKNLSSSYSQEGTNPENEKTGKAFPAYYGGTVDTLLFRGRKKWGRERARNNVRYSGRNSTGGGACGKRMKTAAKG